MNVGEKAQVIATDQVGTIVKVDAEGYWLELDVLGDRAPAAGLTPTRAVPGEPVDLAGPYTADEIRPWQ